METLDGFTIEDLTPVNGVHLILDVGQGQPNANDWVGRNAEHVKRLVDLNGCLLIRGLRIGGTSSFGAMLERIFGEDLLSYRFRSTPRRALRGRVYSASEYPQAESIPLHNENSYTDTWPSYIGFCCITEPGEGGQTPIADSHEVYKAIPDSIKTRFMSDGIKYVRNYGEIDLSWTEVFQTRHKEDVEEYCRAHDIAYEWRDDRLRTTQVAQAAIVHPASQLPVWFNQAHLFHVASLAEDARDSLLEVLGKENLPRNAYLGNGSEITFDEVNAINEIYRQRQVVFDWKNSDVLLLDNMRFSHGRRPFSGARKVIVGMAGATSTAPLVGVKGSNAATDA